MTKIIVAVLAVSVSILAAACGGGAEPAKGPEGAAPAGDTAAPATSGDPAAAPPADPAAAPPAEAPKH